MPTLKWSTRRYRETDAPTFFLGRALYEGSRVAEFEGETVQDMGGGRYDFAHGLSTDEDLMQVLVNAPKITKIIEHELGGRGIVGSVGGLPVEQETSKHGYWHRDAYSLFEDEKMDVELPPFYFTLLVPLLDLSDANDGGGTEFIPGSHTKIFTAEGITNAEQVREWAEGQPKAKPCIPLGSALLFHGNLLHRGTPSVRASRPMLYVVFKKSWYSDEDPAEYLDGDGGEEHKQQLFAIEKFARTMIYK